MTTEEKRTAIKQHCEGTMCKNCPLNSIVNLNTENCFTADDSARQNANVERNYEILFGDSKPTTSHADTVNHPKHYSREGAMECIDEMLLVFGEENTMIFCIMNAWKYRYRAADKGGEEDMRKSDWYMAKCAELKKGVTDCDPQ